MQASNLFSTTRDPSTELSFPPIPSCSSFVPDEILDLFFSYLSPIELIKNVNLSCKHWSNLVHSSRTWKTLLPEYLRGPSNSCVQSNALERYRNAKELPYKLESQYASFEIPNLFNESYTCFYSVEDLLFTASEFGTIAIYQTDTLDLIKAFATNDSKIEALKVQGEDLYLYSHSWDSDKKIINIWNWKTYQFLRSDPVEQIFETSFKLLNYTFKAQQNFLQAFDSSEADHAKKIFNLYFPTPLNAQFYFTFADRRVFILRLEDSLEPQRRKLSHLFYLKPISKESVKKEWFKLNFEEKAYLVYFIVFSFFKAGCRRISCLAKNIVRVFIKLFITIVCSDMSGITNFLIYRPDICLAMLALISIGIGIRKKRLNLCKDMKSSHFVSSQSFYGRLATYMNQAKNQRTLRASF